MAYERKKWEESEALKKQQQALEAYKATKPGAYSSPNQQLSEEALKNWQNYKPFNFDINRDALYNQYKNNYMTQGKLAMQDTIGQAASLTEGYGNSYAQNAGQQAYQGYLQKLNDVVPALQEAAYSRYLQGKEDAYRNWQTFQAKEAQDYSRYMDSVNQFNAEYDRAYNAYNDAYNREYSQFQYDDQRDYQQYQDALAQENWQKQFDADQAYRNWQMSQAAASASRANTVTTAYDNGNVDPEDIKVIQRQLGIPETGYWDESSYKAAGGVSADEAYHLVFSDPDGTWRGDQSYVKNYLAQSPESNNNTSYKYAQGMYEPTTPTYNEIPETDMRTIAELANSEHEDEVERARAIADYYVANGNLSPATIDWLLRIIPQKQ